MAEDKKKRKSSRHFNLEKPVERVFEIEKDVDLIDVTPTKPEAGKSQQAVPIAPVKGPENVKKPSDTPKVEEVKKPEDIKKPTGSPKAEDIKKPEENAVPYNPEGDASDGKSSKWKWLIPAAIVAAAVPSYFLFTGNDDSSSTEDPIVATAPEAGQNNAGSDTTNPNASAGESELSENAAGSDGSGDADNIGGSGNSGGSDYLGGGDNSSETGNVGSSSSGAKVSKPQSSDIQSSPNSQATSVSSTASAGNSIVKEGKTETSSRRGTSESGDSKKSGTTDNPVIPGSIEQKALDVIRGIYGNGQVRKDKLGAEYAEIQKVVNEMYRNGTVKR